MSKQLQAPSTSSSSSSSVAATPSTPLNSDLSLESRAKLLGCANDVAGLEALWLTVPSTARQTFADMALIGATSTSSSSRDSSKSCKEAGQWALRHGACELWGIQQEANLWRRVGKDSNKGLKMLGGPGEVKKGTFSSSGMM